MNCSKAWVGSGIWIKLQRPSASPEHKILLAFIESSKHMGDISMWFENVCVSVWHCACADDPPTLWHFEQWRFFLEHADGFAEIWFSHSLDKYQLTLQYCNITVQPVWPDNTAKKTVIAPAGLAVTSFGGNRPLPSLLLVIYCREDTRGHVCKSVEFLLSNVWK